MCCENVWKRIVPFALALAVGLLGVSILQKVSFADKNQLNVKSVNKITYCKRGEGVSPGMGKGFSTNLDKESSDLDKESLDNSRLVQIISKPRANYSSQARANQTQGTVKLRVDFQANGQIGDVTPVNYLPDGLTEEAIEAAKQIKFKPAAVNGEPISVTKQVEYSFTIY